VRLVIYKAHIREL